VRSAVAACAAALAAFAGATGPALAQPYLYATDATAKVVVFDAGREAATPIWTLSGDDVFGEPYGIAADGRGRLYVADAVTNALVLFGTGARNRSTPALVLRGVAAQGIDVPAGLAAAADGEIFVANLGGGTVSVFPPALGLGLPAARIDTRRLALHGPGAVAIDAAGGRLAVAGFADDAVAFFQRDAAGAWQPAGRLAGPATLLRSPAGLGFDAGGDLFVTNANADSVTAYAPGATGDTAPVRELRGPATRLHNPTGIALAPTGIAYVASFSTAEIEAFGPEADGNATPVRTFSDGLRGPIGLALAPTSPAIATAGDLGISPALATLEEFPSAVLRADGSFTSLDGAVARTRVDVQAGAATVRATIAKGSATQYAGILFGRSLRDRYLLDFDGTGACVIRKFVAGREIRSWPAAVPGLPNGTAPRRFELRVERTPGGLQLSGSVDDDPLGPVVDRAPSDDLNTFVIFTGGKDGTLRDFSVDANMRPRR
jgi:DNA-binding beta-propeller fold protein YncE